MIVPQRLDAFELTQNAWSIRVSKIAAGIETADASDAQRMALDLNNAWRWLDVIRNAAVASENTPLTRPTIGG